MKAKKEELKDEDLKQLLNKSFKEEGISSNFTYQVMQKIDALEKSPIHKPLLPRWAWIVIGTSFCCAILLAIFLGDPGQSQLPDVKNQVTTINEQYSQYALLGFGILALIFIERLLNYLKLLKDLNKPSA